VENGRKNNMMKVSISNGNDKMGRIKSVSLPPVTTCRPDAPCIKKCYARRMLRYPNVRSAYENNLGMYWDEPAEYFKQIENVARLERFFRWHVSGDIPSIDYLWRMVRVARHCEHTQFICFTKKYEIVNQFIFEGGVIPSNLVIVFSVWEGLSMENPYDFPRAKVISEQTADEFGRDSHNVCQGNCATCASNGWGCWYLTTGEVIYLVEH
jgi:hypothetical protein